MLSNNTFFRRLQATFRWLLAIVVLAVLLFLAFQALRPFVLWAVNVELAGRQLEVALAWPDPRRVGDLPQVRDAAALAQARAHLSAAIEQRPNEPHAHRLSGQSYLAEGDWLRAAEALDRAHELAPRHPLIAWEVGLAYEQLEQLVFSAPHEKLLSAVAAGQLKAPAQAINTPFCRDQELTSCYIGQSTFTQPLAAWPEGPELTAPVLFLHSPAQVKHSVTISAEQPALYFLLGLDPAVREWGTDGAVFQVWIETPQEATLAYEQAVDHETARRGWVPDWVDLSPWAGQRVTLVLGTAAGAAGNGNADWFGWGELKLTTIEAARYAVLAPSIHKQNAWQSANLTAEQLMGRGDEAQSRNRPDEAFSWYKRAFTAGSPRAFTLLFNNMIQAAVTQEPTFVSLLHTLQQQDGSLTVYEGDKLKVEIPGTAFRFLTEIPEAGISIGSPLEAASVEEETVARFGGAGEAVALITLSTEGNYLLRASLRDSAPPPLEIAIGADDQPMQNFILEEGDESWQTVEMSMTLGEGVHLIRVRAVNGVEQEAFLQLVKVLKRP